MPLPAPPDRKLLHTRTIVCEGFARDDGLWDIDGWITDVKTYDVDNKDRGGIPAGEPVHGMGLRLTIDEAMVIRDAVAATDFSPFHMCPNITPNFRALIGVSLEKGFTRTVRERLGGTQGCVHLVDLLGPMATVAYQTFDEWRYAKLQDAAAKGDPTPPFFFNTCHAWADTGEAVKHEFPNLYKGSR